MVVAPGEIDELRVDRHAIDDGIAVVEVTVQLAEGSDLGRADEGEILRPEEDDLPLALVAVAGDVGEGGLRVGGNHGLEIEGWELVADGQHYRCSDRKSTRLNSSH